MIENLVFYNHWQNGDVHVSRAFIDFCIKNIKAKNYLYIHPKSKELLKDIPHFQHQKHHHGMEGTCSKFIDKAGKRCPGRPSSPIR